MRPRVHDGDAIGRLRHDTEIVRDEQERQVEGRLHLPEKVENLSLDGHVQRRRRLVGDDERRLAGNRHRDEHPLPHAAGELMRVVVHAGVRLRYPNLLEQIDHRRTSVAPRRAAVDEERFSDLIADREDGVESRHRLLKNQRDLGAANRAQFGFGKRQQIAAFEKDAASGDAARRLHEAA